MSRIIEVSAALIFHNGKLLITQRHADSHLGGLWEFPGGKREANETFEQCLVREIREELGIEISVGELFEEISHDYPEKSVRLKFFICELISGMPKLMGCAAIKWIGKKELKDFEFPAADARLLERLKELLKLWSATVPSRGTSNSGKTSKKPQNNSPVGAVAGEDTRVPKYRSAAVPSRSTSRGKTVSSKPFHRLISPPHNPALRDLIAEKRKWSISTLQVLGKQGFPGWHERGYLPHRDEPGLTQFVTFHLADSFPLTLQSEWRELLEIEDVLERRKQLQGYLDKGFGSSLLRPSQNAKIVEDALKFYHGQHYELLAWVVMPNHVHVLFKVGNLKMSRIVEDWKKFTAKTINKSLNRSGRLWFQDYWDTYIRNAEHEAQTRHYIEGNPVKAFLAREPKEWPWSSARYRDSYDRLCL